MMHKGQGWAGLGVRDGPYGRQVGSDKEEYSSLTQWKQLFNKKGKDQEIPNTHTPSSCLLPYDDRTVSKKPITACGL